MSMRTCLAALSLLTASVAWADTPLNITAGEVALLPPYCPDAQTFGLQGFRGGPHERQRPWVAQMGDAFWGIHHYCWALVSAQRATQPGVTPMQRVALYQAAINDADYVLHNSDPDFVLLPEIYLRMGQFAVGANDLVRAMDYFRKSREKKPDYWPAYIELAKLNSSLGRRQAAIDALNEGLTVMPGEPNLSELLKSIQASAGPAASQARRKKATAKP